MIGWLKRRKMEKRELNELRAFARDMDGVLDNMDLFLSMIDDDPKPIPVEASHFFAAKHFKAPDFRGGLGSELRVPMTGPMRVDFPVPEPSINVDTYHVATHRMEKVNYSMAFSQWDLAFRRTDAERNALVKSISEKIANAMVQKVYVDLAQTKLNPIWQASQV